MRKWFLGQSEIEYQIPKIDQIPVQFLSNTIVGLAEEFVGKELSFIYDIGSKKENLINRIIGILLESDKNSEIRVPIFKSTNTLALGSEKGNWPKYIEQEIYQLIRDQIDQLRLNDLFEKVAIIYRDEIYSEFVEKNYEELKCQLEFSNLDYFQEHDEPFYKSWCIEHQIKLIKKTEISYDASVDVDVEHINLGIIRKGNFIWEKLTMKLLFITKRVLG